MLEHLNHPFLCNLRYSFQDIEYLYVVRHGKQPKMAAGGLMSMLDISWWI